MVARRTLFIAMLGASTGLAGLSLVAPAAAETRSPPDHRGEVSASR